MVQGQQAFLPGQLGARRGDLVAATPRAKHVDEPGAAGPALQLHLDETARRLLVAFRPGRSSWRCVFGQQGLAEELRVALGDVDPTAVDVAGIAGVQQRH